MTIQEFYQEAFRLALAAGAEAAEVYYGENSAFSVNASEGELDRYEVAGRKGLNLRVTVAGRDGYAYAEALDDPAALVARAIDNARAIEITDEHPMQGACEYPSVAAVATPLLDCSEREKIERALLLERETLASDPRVQRAVYCTLATESGRVEIHNTKGLHAERSSRQGYFYVMPVVKEGEESQTALAFRVGANTGDIAGCAAEAVEKAAARLGGKPVASGAYRVILQSEAFSDLLSAFAPIFSAEEAQKGCSLLAGREGESVAAPVVTITDDPFYEGAPTPFDDEGTPCCRKNVIEKGVLKTLLHNLKTAKKANVASTGNAVRASTASPVGVGPMALCVEPGDLPYDALVALMGTGLIITELDGLHAGLDPISGDFSLKASGQYVEDGAVRHAVSQITVAGNFLTLLKAVERVGSDVGFAFPQNGMVVTPSLLVSELAVAGV